MTTKRQKAAIDFCEQTLNIKFNGDLNDFNQVSGFLNMYLDDAKMIAEEAIGSYYSNFLY